jgi:hypothetical protein
MILRLAPEQPVTVNTVLALGLAAAAAVNAWCLSAYL